eukprot:scaffold56279_cov54-Attheya_sp.AAC.5
MEVMDETMAGGLKKEEQLLPPSDKLCTHEPNENDVLCGRGGSINTHPGNENFRELVEKRKRVYLTARFKREKRLIANSIVKEIRQMDPPGRFLSKDGKTNLWGDIGDEKARDKTSQALRENAPKIREELETLMSEQRMEQMRVEHGHSGGHPPAWPGVPPAGAYHPYPPPLYYGYPHPPPPHGAPHAPHAPPHPHNPYLPHPPQHHGAHPPHPPHPYETYPEGYSTENNWHGPQARAQSPHDAMVTAPSPIPSTPAHPPLEVSPSNEPPKTAPSSSTFEIPSMATVPSSFAAFAKSSFSFGAPTGSSNDPLQDNVNTTNMDDDHSQSAASSTFKPLQYHHQGGRGRSVHFESPQDIISHQRRLAQPNVTRIQKPNRSYEEGNSPARQKKSRLGGDHINSKAKRKVSTSVMELTPDHSMMDVKWQDMDPQSSNRTSYSSGSGSSVTRSSRTSRVQQHGSSPFDNPYLEEYDRHKTPSQQQQQQQRVNANSSSWLDSIRPDSIGSGSFGTFLSSSSKPISVNQSNKSNNGNRRESSSSKLLVQAAHHIIGGSWDTTPSVTGVEPIKMKDGISYENKPPTNSAEEEEGQEVELVDIDMVDMDKGQLNGQQELDDEDRTPPPDESHALEIREEDWSAKVGGCHTWFSESLGAASFFPISSKESTSSSSNNRAGGSIGNTGFSHADSIDMDGLSLCTGSVGGMSIGGGSLRHVFERDSITAEKEGDMAYVSTTDNMSFTGSMGSVGRKVFGNNGGPGSIKRVPSWEKEFQNGCSSPLPFNSDSSIIQDETSMTYSKDSISSPGK